jgi:hypothetical protein
VTIDWPSFFFGALWVMLPIATFIVGVYLMDYRHARDAERAAADTEEIQVVP